PPHNSGGLGVACEGLTKALAKDGVDIEFVLPFSYGGDLSHMKVIDCYEKDWFSELPGHEELYNAPPFNAYTSTSMPQESAEKVSKLLEGELPEAKSILEKRVTEYADLILDFARKHADEFDVVHAHDWMTMPAAIKIKEELGKPYIAHIHSTEYDRSLSLDNQSFIVRSEYEGMRLADRVIAVSYYTKRLLVEKYDVNPYKIDVIHNGVLPILEKLAGVPQTFAQKRPVIVFMGRLTIQKGPDYFLELAGKVLEEKPDALFIVAGMGDMYEQLLFHNAGKSLSASVLFSGFVRGKVQNEILDRADVFVMPSLSEPFGLVAAEAAGRHTPVILSKTSGASEVMTESPKLDFWDVDGMTKEVIRLLDDKPYHDKIVQAQYEALQSNSWKKAAKKVESLYDKLRKKQSKPRKT
ncbi:MAG: glycosyltransferase family 4 protein, partial [Pseudomonadales bacterium]|nr:glycosyltransferase family 4 protein [Pseudomonadales bacterium]